MENSLVFIAAPVAGWIIAQTIKFALTLRKDGFNWHDLVQSGGMPSSHAAFMSSITTAIGLAQGFGSAEFALALAITGIVVYDSVGVRRTTGQQTDTLKRVVTKLNVKSDVTYDARGHNPAEAFLGILVGVLAGAITVYIL